MKKTRLLTLMLGFMLAACAPDTPTPDPPATDDAITEPTGAATDDAITEPTGAATDRATGAPVEVEITDEPTQDASDAALPDLAFSGFSITMEGHTPGMCVEALGPITTTVCVRNQGDGPAGAFVVKGGVPDWVVDGLAVGEETCTNYAGSPRDMTIDPDGAVDESDDNNNFYVLPVPTQPVICTPEGDG